MFFYLAKVIWFFAQPSGLLLLLLLISAALLMTGRDRVGRRLVAASAGLLLFGGWLPVSNWLMLPLEQRFPRADLAGEVRRHLSENPIATWDGAVKAIAEEEA